jgi:hypothetical protein
VFVSRRAEEERGFELRSRLEYKRRRRKQQNTFRPAKAVKELNAYMHACLLLRKQTKE